MIDGCIRSDRALVEPWHEFLYTARLTNVPGKGDEREMRPAERCATEGWDYQKCLEVNSPVD